MPAMPPKPDGEDVTEDDLKKVGAIGCSLAALWEANTHACKTSRGASRAPGSTVHLGMLSWCVCILLSGCVFRA